jgi:antitoxin PrlF
MGKKMSFVTLRAKNQLTLPVEVSEAVHLSEGDPIEIRVVDEGILLLPKKIVDAGQAWFWTPAWQKGERRASEDIALGRVERFETDEDFLGSFGQ